MIGQYLISFREALEAALVSSIILAYLARTGRGAYSIYFWVGVAASVAASLAVAAGVWLIYGGLAEEQMKLFEGAAALTAVAVLTTMILWMATRAAHIREEIQQKVRSSLKRGSMISLVSVAFVVVFREGFETVLFLIPFATDDFGGTIVGLSLGITTALMISYAVFRLGLEINLRRMFYLTSLLLVLLAGGLAGYGVHELIEYQEAIGNDLGWFASPAYDLGIPRDSPLHHKGLIGSIFAVMLGYSASMEWGRVTVHSAYLGIFVPLTIIAYRRPEWLQSVAAMIRRLFQGFAGIGSDPKESEEADEADDDSHG